MSTRCLLPGRARSTGLGPLRLAQATGQAAWGEFIALDGVLARIGDAADERLAFQASFPIYN
ncbi:hypothetical protein [Streptomyces sp. NBC_01373]|uniref:hypothetical protein n=1 Tax=Streptomyces sp. NBC_01373 TaxID=2903843 RepID=UPI00225A9372|nr:hypothetical protein [Streptomyces sp. NBC_01373]MCX4706872.1 hypothetical protein [Streptomyces sp. NBC_01373]